jgi:hypothetical protein
MMVVISTNKFSRSGLGSAVPGRPGLGPAVPLLAYSWVHDAGFHQLPFLSFTLFGLAGCVHAVFNVVWSLLARHVRGCAVASSTAACRVLWQQLR